MARLEGKSAWSCTLTAALVWFAASVAFGANMPPTVSINGYGMGPYSISPCALAQDSDGSIAKVEFYANGRRIGESTSPSSPYCYSWTNVAVGVYSIAAVATDDDGATATSAPITVEIKHPFGGHILTPTNGQVFTLGDVIRLTSTVTNGEGIVRVRYAYDGFQGQFPELTNAPYEFTTTAPSLGKHLVSGLAVHGASNPNQYALLAPVDIYVVPARGFPVITAQPTNQVINSGANVVLSVSAFAELPITYQWRFNGSNIPDATNDQLRLQNVRPEQAGAYSVLLSTAAGAWPSDVAFLDVLRPNGGTLLFANRYIRNGTALVDAPLSNLGPNREARLYAGTRPDALRLVGGPLRVTDNYFNGGPVEVPTVAPGDAAYVRIIVRDPNAAPGQDGEASNVLRIETGDDDTPAPLVGMRFWPYPVPPPLTPDPFLSWDRPQLAAGTAGDAFEIPLVFQSWQPRATWQWQKDGQDIPGAAGICERPGNRPSVTCEVPLVFTNLTLDDAGSYSLRIDNGKSITMSAPALLGIIEPPRGRFAALIVDDDVCQARLHGSIGDRYTIQSSSNLRDWTTVATVTNVTGTIALPKPLSGRQNFYRARLVP